MACTAAWRFQFPFMSHCPWAQLDSGPNIACVAPSGVCSPPGREREQKQQPIGHTHSLRLERGKAATAGLCVESLGHAHSGCKFLPMPMEAARHLHATQHWCLNSQLPHSHLLQCIHTAISGPLPISNLLIPCFSTEPLPAFNSSLYFSSYYTSELHFY